LENVQELKGGEWADRECPKCHSGRIAKKGLRKINNGFTQRYGCGDCGFRFSDKSYKECTTNEYSQLCAEFEAKKLDTATEIKTVAGEVEKEKQELDVTIVQYALKLKNKGKTKKTIETYVTALNTLLNKGANILDPLSVEEIISKQDSWSARAKVNYCNWYARFARYLHLDWEKPGYNAPRQNSYFPLEKEIDLLIAKSSNKVSIAQQIAKETAARIGEIVQIEWSDVNFEQCTLAINHPEKRCYSGVYKITDELVRRISKLPRVNHRIFGKASADSISAMQLLTRKRLSTDFCNPNIMKIHFHIFRHWKLTTIAGATRDFFITQKFARHKDAKSTQYYIDLAVVCFNLKENDEWVVRAVKTAEEAIKLIEVGFMYVNDIDGYSLYKKRK
jgi:integrase